MHDTGIKIFKKMFTGLGCENMAKRDGLEFVGLNSRIILKWI